MTRREAERRLAQIASKRKLAAELESAALDALVESFDAIRGAGFTVAEVAERAGFKTRKPVYDALERRAAR